MSIELGDPASKMWLSLIKEHPIDTISGVVYSPHQHGTSSGNFPIWRWRGEISTPETSKRWPFFDFEISDRVDLQRNELVALGSPVYISPRDRENTSGPETMAIITMDFDCPKAENNLERIRSTLASTFNRNQCVILDSGNSYHAIINTLIPPKNIPWHYGQIIKAFAESEPPDKREIFEKLGTNLQTHYQDSEKIRGIANAILKEFKHFGESRDGLTFIFDLRWLAHVLIEFLNFNGYYERGGFAHLRVSKNSEGNPPPFVIAVDR